MPHDHLGPALAEVGSERALCAPVRVAVVAKVQRGVQACRKSLPHERDGRLVGVQEKDVREVRLLRRRVRNCQLSV